MASYLVSTHQSNSTSDLDRKINDFIKNNNDIKVITISTSSTVSPSSVWDAGNNYLIYTGTILYKLKGHYKEEIKNHIQ